MSDPKSLRFQSGDPEEITVSQNTPTSGQPSQSSQSSQSGQAHFPGIPMPDDSGENTVSQDEPTQFQEPEAEPTPSVMSIEEWLNKLRSSDRAFYNIMAMEIWSLAKSMDTLVPGFWSRFMINRRNAMQQFVKRQRTHDTTPSPASESEAPTDEEPTQAQNESDTQSP